MRTYFIILDITILRLTERIKCKSDIVITTITSVFRDCCNKIFGYLEKDDVKIKCKLKEDNIYIQVLMENSVYSKKIGKYVKDQQRKILNDLSVMTRLKLEKIDWKEILKRE